MCVCVCVCVCSETTCTRFQIFIRFQPIYGKISDQLKYQYPDASCPEIGGNGCIDVTMSLARVANVL